MTASYCQLCGAQIAGRGKLFHHPKWPRDRSLRVCQDCYQTRPRCRSCGMPLAAATPNGICMTCAESQKFCLTCGKSIRGNYLEFDGAGPYCEDCCRTRPSCDVCAAPLTDERWQLSDGRLSCARCHATAIYAPPEATALYEELKGIITRTFGLTLAIPTGLALVDRTQLAEIIRQQTNGKEPLDPDRTLGVYARKGMRRGIYVQSGLPRTLLIQIAAHEYAHAWQGENCPLLRDPVIHEGFAEWLAYKITGFYGLQKQQTRMQARTDLYGQGLQWALAIEATQGMAGLIEACRNAKS